jgi:hypothetical protein
VAEQTRDLRDSRQVILGASGAGSVSFGPQRPNTRWVITRTRVTVSTNVLEPQANLYHSAISPALGISGTFAGSNDTDDGLNETLFPGDVLVMEWTGGDVGATATCAFAGQEIAGMA